MSKVSFSVKQVEKAIGVKRSRWIGNCFGIATLAEKAKLLPGAKAVYGIYFGTTHHDSIFAGRPFTHHGWLVHKKKKIIVDPTWWTITQPSEAVIHVTDIDDEDYDEAGVSLRSSLQKPYPVDDPYDRSVKIKFSKRAALALSAVTPRDADYFRQGEMPQVEMVWISNSDPSQFGDRTEEIFKTICKAGLVAFIPLDVRNMLEIE